MSSGLGGREGGREEGGRRVRNATCTYQEILEWVGPDIVFNNLSRFILTGITLTKPVKEAHDIFVATFSSLNLWGVSLYNVLKRREGGGERERERDRVSVQEE